MPVRDGNRPQGYGIWTNVSILSSMGKSRRTVIVMRPQNTAPQANPPARTAKNNPPRPRRRGPLSGLFRYIGNRLFLLLLVLIVILGGSGACALFLPALFSQTIKAAQSAGLSVYTVVLGVTGNPTLQLTTYQAQVTAQTKIRRDMGVLSLLYGESAQITGKITVSLGADLKKDQFGVLSCDLDPSSIQTDEQRAPLAGAAFDPQSIKQAAYSAFEVQAAQQAIANYWPQARKGLQGQFASWALGLTVPELPTLSTCPSLQETAVATATVAPANAVP